VISHSTIVSLLLNVTSNANKLPQLINRKPLKKDLWKNKKPMKQLKTNVFYSTSWSKLKEVKVMMSNSEFPGICCPKNPQLILT
jgi:uncharacterized protein (DUF1919 family)